MHGTMVACNYTIEQQNRKAGALSNSMFPCAYARYERNLDIPATVCGAGTEVGLSACPGKLD